MNSSSSRDKSNSSSSLRYEGLDAFRGFAAFGVVWLHTFLAGTADISNPSVLSSQSNVWLRLRDFSLPLIVLSSFFVLTISLIRKPESKFLNFFATRFKRLWLPLFIWTSVYCLVWAYVIPRYAGFKGSGQLPSLDVFISGYMHLWFLQFIFLGSLAVYPILRWLRGKSEPERIKLSILFFLTAAIYAVTYKLFIQTVIYHSLLLFEHGPSLVIFTTQASKYVFFIPVAIGLGLLNNKINNLYKQSVFRICSLTAVLFTLIAHLTMEHNSLTAPMYGIAVFIAALQPWKRIPLRLVYISAAYSYGIYIFHYLLCELLLVLVLKGGNKLDGTAIFSISLLFYSMSFGVAVLLRKILPVNWFIPLVPVRLERSERGGSS